MVLILALVQIVTAAQTLTMNNEAVDEVTLKTGQICIVQIVSDNSNTYSAYIGFDDRVVLGTFAPFGKYPEAGDLASITEYDIPAFYGYYASAAGTSPPPSPGNHFVITYQPQQVGETELKLYDSLRMTVIAKVHITVVSAQMGTVFTYQGRLLEAGDPADGQYDFEFKLYNAPSYGSQIEGTIEANDLDVINGYFTKELDFGSDVFNGDACWLDISVRPGDSTSSFTSLGPRQRITSTPYSLQTRGIFVDDSGNVGIRTENPSNDLHIYDSTHCYVDAESETGYAFFQADGHRNSGLTIKENGTNKAHVYWDTANASLNLNEGGGDRLVVKGGKVGIGTTNPEADIEVRHRAGSHRVIKATASDGSDLFYVAEHDSFGNAFLGVNDGAGTSKVFITANGYSYFDGGNVAIGRTYPQARLDIDGDLKVSGAYKGDIGPNDGAPFPRPAYDSSWVVVAPGSSTTFTHNIGGNVHNYVVDMQFERGGWIHNKGIGTRINEYDTDGAYYNYLNTSTIDIILEEDTTYIERVRVRIWVYN